MNAPRVLLRSKQGLIVTSRCGNEPSRRGRFRKGLIVVERFKKRRHQSKGVTMFSTGFTTAEGNANQVSAVGSADTIVAANPTARVVVRAVANGVTGAATSVKQGTSNDSIYTERGIYDGKENI